MTVGSIPYLKPSAFPDSRPFTVTTDWCAGGYNACSTDDNANERVKRMDKKSLLAIVLIALLWGVYFIITKPEHPKTRHEGKGTVTEQRTEKAEKAAESALRLEVPVSGGTEQTIPIETKKYSILLSNRGASIVGCTYRERNIDLIVITMRSIFLSR